MHFGGTFLLYRSSDWILFTHCPAIVVYKTTDTNIISKVDSYG